MDRKTLVLMLTEALLIVVLVVVIALDFNKAPAEKHVAASHDAVHEEAAQDAAVEEKTEVAEAPAAKEVAKAEIKEEAPEAEEVAEKEEVKKEVAEKAEKAAPAAAGKTEVADVIAMDNPTYAKHKKTIVQFTHKKHIEEYKLSCGECHHDEKAEPLKDLKMGDAVQGCIACHDKPGKAPKEVKDKAEKLTYHTNALHKNCIDCHKAHNKKNNTKAAPASCGQCHVKKK
ncbi:cytochrome c, class III family protein [Desulfonema ishimotonii]|uniref:Cytochrome c, class III family protein n=1 Tax=Desulfonema ishimotonii TaxID=45657 RepID=A0A401FQ40_9BACT|nr:cytochrome c3 family protein [Desulfonema ishimotonii]GBC59103.1 cytochrome c, class III family protein [Desulfonema ishimotonii]